MVTDEPKAWKWLNDDARSNGRPPVPHVCWIRTWSGLHQCFKVPTDLGKPIEDGPDGLPVYRGDC